MTEMTEADVEAVDVGIVAYRDDGDWYVQHLRKPALASVDALAAELRRYPGETGALALIGIDEDFVILVRVAGASVRLLLSDGAAATDWWLAQSIVERLGVRIDPTPEDEEDEEDPVPAGDLDILSDLGLPTRDLAALLDDLDLYPDEVLSEIAHRLGFGTKFDDLAGLDT